MRWQAKPPAPPCVLSLLPDAVDSHNRWGRRFRLPECLSASILNQAFMKRLLLITAFASLLIYADLPTRRAFPGHARVKLAIRAEDGRPTGVRLRVTNSAGEYFAPLGHLPLA